MITVEAWKLEARLISRMLERIGISVELSTLTFPEFLAKWWIPCMGRPPEEQDWDLAIWHFIDWYGNTGASFLTWYLIEGSDCRWTEYDPIYEAMWKKMAQTVDRKAQEQEIKKMARYVHNKAHLLFIYSPLMLYGVNKEVNYIPYNDAHLHLKETSVTENHWSLRGKGN
jgi:ABC-type transport system substrate-binding protein